MAKNRMDRIAPEEINDNADETIEKATASLPEEKKSILKEDTTDKPDSDKKKSLVDIMYDKINEVLGGDNANQYFCMTFPGTILSPHTYSYDYLNNQPKPPTVEANESRLANKLFDPCHITGADNGRSLAQQYSTALDMLTPKLNARIQEAKNSLRSMLMTPYPYDFGNGMDTSLTLQQVFFRLYDDWVKLKMEWSKLQADKKAELAKKYGTDSAEDNAAQQNEYLTWYQTVAEGYLEGLNGQYSKILAVFSPNNMKIIEGILDSGSGAELEEARETLQNIRKSNPNGGYIYPVSLTPKNWFELLDNSFTGIDLLDSPEALSEQMYLLSSQRMNLVAQANSITEAIPDDAEIDAKKNAVATAQADLNKTESVLVSNYGQGASAVLHAALDISEAVGSGGITAAILNRLISKTGTLNPDDGNLISSLTTAISSAGDAQHKYVDACQQLSDAQMAYIESKNMQSLKEILVPIRTQIEQLDLEISNLSNKIKLSSALSGSGDSGDKNDDPDTKPKFKAEIIESVTPNKVPKGFMQLVIQESASTMNNNTSRSASSSSSTSGINFFFCGGSTSSSQSESAFSSYTASDKCTVEIGMSVAKVEIGCDWFNPGLFTLTGDMYNVTSEKIAPNNVSITEFDDNRLREMNKCVFPCFPTAFVVARDVSVKLTTEDAISSQTAMAMEQHASKGGGFLFFSGSSSSSSSGSSSSAHVSSKANSTTIRFTDPQILGYYIEATPADNSTALADASKTGNDEYVTILDFVKKCKELLLQHRNEMIG